MSFFLTFAGTNINISQLLRTFFNNKEEKNIDADESEKCSVQKFPFQHDQAPLLVFG